jgi:hypothetical protein
LRKAQNRAAQRTFRERKAQRLRDLESTVAELSKARDASKNERRLLMEQKRRVQFELVILKRLAAPKRAVRSLPPTVTATAGEDDSRAQLQVEQLFQEDESSDTRLFDQFVQSPRSDYFDIDVTPDGSLIEAEDYSYLPDRDHLSDPMNPPDGLDDFDFGLDTNDPPWNQKSHLLLDSLAQTDPALSPMSPTHGHTTHTSANSQDLSEIQYQNPSTCESGAHNDSDAFVSAYNREATAHAPRNNYIPTCDLSQADTAREQAGGESGAFKHTTLNDDSSHARASGDSHEHLCEVNHGYDLASLADSDLSWDLWDDTLVQLLPTDLPLCEADVDVQHGSPTLTAAGNDIFQYDNTVLIKDRMGHGEKSITSAAAVSSEVQSSPTTDSDADVNSDSFSLDAFVGIGTVW